MSRDHLIRILVSRYPHGPHRDKEILSLLMNPERRKKRLANRLKWAKTCVPRHNMRQKANRRRAQPFTLASQIHSQIEGA